MIEADLVAAAVRAVMATRTEWTGTASDPPRPRRRASASPSQRSGRMALGRWQAGCAGRGPVRFTSLPPRAKRLRTMAGRDRPHRPHRPPAETLARQQLRGARLADGCRSCGRSNGRQRFDRPRQPVENERRDPCGRCGRKSFAPIRASKYRLEGAAMSAAQAQKAARARTVWVIPLVYCAQFFSHTLFGASLLPQHSAHACNFLFERVRRDTLSPPFAS